MNEGRITIEHVCLRPSFWLVSFEPELSIEHKDLLLSSLTTYRRNMMHLNYTPEKLLASAAITAGRAGDVYLSTAQFIDQFTEFGYKVGYPDVAVFDEKAYVARDVADIPDIRLEALGLLDPINSK